MPSQPDMTGCAAEPIRVPGSIQPHGWMAVLETCSGRLIAYSDNWESLIDGATGLALTAAVQATIDALQPLVEIETRPVSIGTATISGRVFHATAHRAEPLMFIELEPVLTRCAGSLPWITSLTHRIVPLLRVASSVSELASVAVSQLKALTGFGRCMLYAFDAEGHGSVLAECLDPGYGSYAGHRFPASDIPQQARDLYLVNPIRLIPDATYVPSAVRFVDAAWNAPGLDLSFAQLRSVSPVHLEYLRNMGTLASMSVSIIVRDRLWGLISWHNHEPRGVDFQTRSACEHLGLLVSLQIEALEASARAQRRDTIRTTTMSIVSRLGNSGVTLEDLVDAADLLLGLTRASGAAVIFHDQCWSVGDVPAPLQLLDLASWACAREAEVCAVTNLVAAGAPLGGAQANAAGMLSICLSRERRHVVIWFRPEVNRSVRWAGEPAKQVDAQGRLHPRRSFESWEQVVRGECLPWTEDEVDGAAELRELLVHTVVRRAQERADAATRLGLVTMAKDLAEQADASKTHFLAVVTHELRNPLGAISSAAALLERHAEIPARFSNLIPMIKRSVALEARLINDLLDVSAVSTGKLNLAFEEVEMHVLLRHVEGVLTPELAAKDLRLCMDLRASLTMVSADPARMQQVVWNILSNAIKFTPAGGKIKIGSELEGNDLVVRCTDSGIGLKPEALVRIFNAFEQVDDGSAHKAGGLGLGLAIAMGIVQGHGGELSAASQGLGRGTTLTLRLPLLQTSPLSTTPTSRDVAT